MFGLSFARRETAKRFSVSLLTVMAIFSSSFPSIFVPGPAKAADLCEGSPPVQEGRPKVINLVVDDSGSMFYDKELDLDRWSFAKYSLAVFAALMGPQDEINVYRLSDFDGLKDDLNGPALIVRGADADQVRIESAYALDMQAGDTPIGAMEQAFSDLEAAPSVDRWLVVLTDGAFKRSREVVDDSELTQLLNEYASSSENVNVAFLRLGSGPNGIEPKVDAASGLFIEQADTSTNLLNVMTSFANRIFGRNVIELPSSGSWEPGSAALELSEAIVFAQGKGVSLGDATTASGAIAPNLVVDVPLPSNGPITRKGEPRTLNTNESLQGQVAYFGAIPKGDVQFAVTNSAAGAPVSLFYTPDVRVGFQLVDEEGNLAPSEGAVAGSYTVNYGFMDTECNFIESSLLGDVDYDQVAITQGDQVIADEFPRGSVIEIPKGEVSFTLSASYLEGTKVGASYTRNFAPPALPAEMTAGSVSYLVSELSDYPPAAQRIKLQYMVVDKDGSRSPTLEEWDQLDESEFEFVHDSNLEFDVNKLQEPGQLELLVRAPEGDVYAASTGDLSVLVKEQDRAGNGENIAQVEVPFEVVDDLDTWDRFLNWLKTDGWKWLLALLLIAIILGYLFKRRFSKRVKRRPSISGTPRMVGQTAIQDYGKFQVSGIRRLLPFVANTATLSYVPAGTAGFRVMKLKAGPSKTMIVTNWKDIAGRDNVEVNGTPLNSESKRAPRFGPGGTITASTPQMSYELIPNA